MIQLQILSGRQAGVTWTARLFPVRVGRNPGNSLVLEEDGIWDHHFTLEFKPGDGVMLTTRSEALLTINQEPARQVRLRNGDTIEAGSVRLRCWIAAPVQRGLRLREWLIWALILGVCLGQVVLIYRLLP